ncbi:hypothetical protein BDN72DRAFT_831831 [Pluteus cervinus]|uniref:Uncharacterized protein n=1 Tax=Pluteus cervinus TaxID=181527 RepID=A0ACD3BD49_9AGAR|nr:hypothetical protein BDN72DRAFT_831831 [Pluteus cervinus]
MVLRLRRLIDRFKFRSNPPCSPVDVCCCGFNHKRSPNEELSPIPPDDIVYRS